MLLFNFCPAAASKSQDVYLHRGLQHIMDLRIVYNFKPKYCDDEVREMETLQYQRRKLVQLFYLRHDLMSACLREYRP